MSANDSTPASSPINEAAELFEDENEQFIRSLEDTPSASKPIEQAPATPTKEALDEVLPDAHDEEEAIEEEPVQPTPPAKAEPTPPPATPVAKPIAPNEEPLTKLDQVKVNIKLEVGKVSCSLQKLLSLKENDIVELNQPIGQIIDLRVEGRLIGKGQIVKLGDQLGLRISELADR